VPIYEFAFPAEATDEELAAFVRAREEWAQLQLDAKVAECRAHSQVRAHRLMTWYTGYPRERRVLIPFAL